MQSHTLLQGISQLVLTDAEQVTTYPIPPIRVPPSSLSVIRKRLDGMETDAGDAEHLGWSVWPRGGGGGTYGDDDPVGEQSLEGDGHGE